MPCRIVGANHFNSARLDLARIVVVLCARKRDGMRDALAVVTEPDKLTLRNDLGLALVEQQPRWRVQGRVVERDLDDEVGATRRAKLLQFVGGPERLK